MRKNESSVTGVRTHGGPRERWIDEVNEVIRATGQDVEEVKMCVKDRAVRNFRTATFFHEGVAPRKNM